MRIVQYLPAIRFEGGGPVRALIDLSNALAARGHAVTVATCDGGDAPPEWNDPSPGTPQLTLLPRSRLPGGLLSRAAMRRLGEMIGQADIVHLHGMWLPSNIQIGAAARRLGVPYIVSPRGMLDDWCMMQRGPKKRLYLRLGGRRWLEHAGAVHFTAQAELEQSRKHFSGRMTVIPNLLDLQPFATLPGPALALERFAPLRSGRQSLLFLSRVHYKKGPEALIQAASELARAGTDVEVLIAGPGEPAYIDTLNQLAQRLGIADRTHMLGIVTGDDKLSLYQAADLFVLPTSQENFGFVFFESLLCATPVVTTPDVDTWPELEASGGARITPPDPAALAATLRELLLDRPRLERMGADGRKYMLDFLDSERIVDQFETMYTSCSGGHVSRSSLSQMGGC